MQDRTYVNITWLVVVLGAAGSLARDKLWRALYLTWHRKMGKEGLYCLGVDLKRLRKCSIRT